MNKYSEKELAKLNVSNEKKGVLGAINDFVKEGRNKILVAVLFGTMTVMSACSGGDKTDGDTDGDRDTITDVGDGDVDGDSDVETDAETDVEEDADVPDGDEDADVPDGDEDTDTDNDVEEEPVKGCDGVPEDYALTCEVVCPEDGAVTLGVEGKEGEDSVFNGIKIIDLVNNINDFIYVTNYPFEDAEYNDYPAFVLDEIWDEVIGDDESGELDIVARRFRCYVLDTLTQERENLDDTWRNVEKLAKQVKTQLLNKINFIIKMERRAYRRFIIGAREIVAVEMVFLTKYAEAISEEDKII